jgi:hypothetical protein
MNFLQLFQLLRLLKCFASNFLLILANLQGFCQFGYLLFEVNVRRLSKSKVAFKFLGFLGKLLVCLLLINKPFNGNFPEHGRFKGVIFLKPRQLGRRIRTKEVLEF